MNSEIHPSLSFEAFRGICKVSGGSSFLSTETECSLQTSICAKILHIFFNLFSLQNCLWYASLIKHLIFINVSTVVDTLNNDMLNAVYHLTTSHCQNCIILYSKPTLRVMLFREVEIIQSIYCF